ncbi:OsmC family protein [Candidatus Dependentiae bacterium]|nr:OsmC family protein [Candidatus Dependentiae bacterium]
MDIKVNWLNNMTFEGYGKTGTNILMDTPVDKGGEDKGPTPKEIYLMSVAGCTGMDVISILKKKRLTVTGFEIEVFADEIIDTHPHIFTKIKIHYSIIGKDLTEPAIKQAIDLSQNKYCGVSEMMRKAFEIEYTFEFNNEKE